MIIELTDMPALARGIVLRPEGQGLDETQVLYDLYVAFSRGGQNGVKKSLYYPWYMLYQIIGNGYDNIVDHNAIEEQK